MNLIHDERAYRKVLANFVSSRVGATVFISNFAHLWKCDGAPIDGDPDIGRKPGSGPGFYGCMDAVNALCVEYTRSLPDGFGYRVSEEQFRREIQALVGAEVGLIRATAGDAAKASIDIQ
ncbi:MAG: hypothetical protein ABIR54_14585 [Burkholderiaceae bacterium]|jgi:hypothetical protein